MHHTVASRKQDRIGREDVVSHRPNRHPGPIPCPADASISSREDELPLDRRREDSIDRRLA